jgi:hypothetical protein
LISDQHLAAVSTVKRLSSKYDLSRAPVLPARLAGNRRYDAVITADDEGQIADNVVDWPSSRLRS